MFVRLKDIPMRKPLALLFVPLLVISAKSSADEIPLESFYVNNGWTGESFHLFDNTSGSSNKYMIVHEIYGSGVPVIYRKEHPVDDQNPASLAFTIEGLKFTIKAEEGKAAELFLNGYQLATQ